MIVETGVMMRVGYDPHEELVKTSLEEIDIIDQGIEDAHHLMRVRDRCELLLERNDLPGEVRESIRLLLEYTQEKRYRTNDGKVEEFEDTLAEIARRRAEIKRQVQAHQASAQPSHFDEYERSLAIRPPNWEELAFLKRNEGRQSKRVYRIN